MGKKLYELEIFIRVFCLMFILLMEKTVNMDKCVYKKIFLRSLMGDCLYFFFIFLNGARGFYIF